MDFGPPGLYGTVDDGSKSLSSNTRRACIRECQFTDPTL
jgi:hypothetical protein